MAKTLTIHRAGSWLGGAVVLALLARPWWQHGWPVRPDAVCLAAVLAAYAAAITLWLGGTGLRFLTGLVLVAAASPLVPPPLRPAGIAFATITLPTLAALRRAPPAIIAEATVAGAGAWRLGSMLILKLAAPGLIYGALLLLAVPPQAEATILVAAALPLLIARQPR